MAVLVLVLVGSIGINSFIIMMIFIIFCSSI